jgi:hypothetical protein
VSDEFPEPGEGNSPAAWTAVIIMLVAFSIGTIAFFFNVQFMVWASAGLLIVGIIVGFVLKHLGYGVYGARYNPKGH